MLFMVSMNINFTALNQRSVLPSRPLNKQNARHIANTYTVMIEGSDAKFVRWLLYWLL